MMGRPTVDQQRRTDPHRDVALRLRQVYLDPYERAGSDEARRDVAAWVALGNRALDL